MAIQDTDMGKVFNCLDIPGISAVPTDLDPDTYDAACEAVQDQVTFNCLDRMGERYWKPTKGLAMIWQTAKQMGGGVNDGIVQSIQDSLAQAYLAGLNDGIQGTPAKGVAIREDRGEDLPTLPPTAAAHACQHAVGATCPAGHAEYLIQQELATLGLSVDQQEDSQV
jgi:hypothetical protein